MRFVENVRAELGLPLELAIDDCQARGHSQRVLRLTMHNDALVIKEERNS